MSSLKLFPCLIVALAASCPAQEVDAKRMAAAQTLAETMGLKEQMTAGFDAMSPMIDQQAATLRLSPEESQELHMIYKDWFAKDLDQEAILKQTIQLYAEEYTVEELEGLTAFYKTPLGQKLLKTQPKMMAQGAKFGMEEAQAKQAKLMERLEPFFKKRSLK